MKRTVIFPSMWLSCVWDCYDYDCGGEDHSGYVAVASFTPVSGVLVGRGHTPAGAVLDAWDKRTYWASLLARKTARLNSEAYDCDTA
jgi:hypothetical protein